MTVRIYQSTDASAPVLTGQVGKLTDLLDAILVNGYGAKTAAGWTIGYTATNKRAYLQNLIGANNAAGMYLYVDDNGPGAGAAKEARTCSFETMSAITPVGTGQFPTGAQSAIGSGQLVIRKSFTADATARPWTCIANGQTVYLFIETGDFATTPTYAAFPFIFGDYFPAAAADPYAVQIIGRTGENTSLTSHDWLAAIGSPGTALGSLATSCSGHYTARSWPGVGGSVQFGKTVDQTLMGIAGSTNLIGIVSTAVPSNASGIIALGRNANNPTFFAYPNGPDGGLYMSPIRIHHNNSVRGYMKGLWAPLHDRPLNHGDTFSGTGNLAGKSFICQQIPAFISSGNDVGQIVIETSDTWT